MKTYYQTRNSKFVGTIVSAVILGLWGLIILYFFPFFVLQVASIWLGVIILIALLNSILTASIAVSQKGIVYSVPLRTFSVDWEGFERIGKRWFTEGLIVHSGYLVTFSNTIPSNIKAYSFPFYDFIPLSTFADNWRDSELGQQIKQYAPHLFEKEESVQSA